MQPARRVAVVGAGVVGLSAAWFLQEHGIEVTVLERDHVGAGASSGSAGWLLADDVTPLPSPETLAAGVRGLLDSRTAVSIAGRPSLHRYLFLMRFARHCTPQRWRQSLLALQPLAHTALTAYDALADGGVHPTSAEATPHWVLFSDLKGRDDFIGHLETLKDLGGQVAYDVVESDALDRECAVASDAVRGAIALHGQRFVDPALFLPALAESVLERGGRIREQTVVLGIRRSGHPIEVLLTQDGQRARGRFDAVVVCTGAWLSPLVRSHGVRLRVQAGRGYSFAAALDRPFFSPVYLPDQHVACTPMRGRLRVAGTMEFAEPRAPLRRGQIERMVEAARPLLRGVDLDDRIDEWVGPRPVSQDGLPLAGPTRTPDVWCIGGHAMEGMVLGPVTARMTAQAIATGDTPAVLRPFDPRR